MNIFVFAFLAYIFTGVLDEIFDSKPLDLEEEL
jgi:hypothetical protein